MRLQALFLALTSLILLGMMGERMTGGWSAAADEETGKEPAEWYLLFRKGDLRKAVSVDGKQVIELKDDPRLRYDPDALRLRNLRPDPPMNAVLSSDGRQLAYVGKVDNGKAVPHPSNGQVCVCRPDGSEARVVVSTAARRHHLSWSPDRRQLAYDEEMKTNGDSGAGPEWIMRVHVADVATGVVRRSFAGTSDVSHPRFTPKGNLTYQVLRGRNGKLTLNDLEYVKLDGTPDEQFRGSRTLVNRQFFLGSSFLADESKLAYTIPHVMVVRSLDGQAEERWTVADVGKELGIEWYLCFDTPVWRPDGKTVACRCVFLGGRMAGDDTPIKGEEQVVIFPLGGKARAFSFEPHWALEGWATKADIEALRK